MAIVKSKVLCHIGNPKAYSTSIQAYLSQNQKEQYSYFGFSPQQKIDNWYNSSFVSKFLDYDLRFQSDYFYNKKPNNTLDNVEILLQDCLEKEMGIWISSETLSNRYLLEDIDISTKFNRIQDILPSNTSFVIVFRNLYQSIVSLYKELVKQRYSFDFNIFCKELYLFRESNILISLIPDTILNYLSSLIKNNNKLITCYVDPVKNVNTQIKHFLKDISDFTYDDKFYNFNSSKKRENIDYRLRLNRSVNKSISYSGLVENHRAFYNLRNDSDFDYIIWSKLKEQKSNLNNSLTYNKIQNFKIPKLLIDYVNEIKKDIFVNNQNNFFEYGNKENIYKLL